MPQCYSCGRFMRLVAGAAWKMVYSGWPMTPDREIFRCKGCVERIGPFRDAARHQAGSVVRRLQLRSSALQARLNIYSVLCIEKRQDGTFWVLDKRGANVVEAGPFSDMEAAQAKWKDIAGDIHVDAILATSDVDALAGRWPKPDHLT